MLEAPLDRIVLDGSAIPVFEEAMRRRIHDVLDWMLARKAQGVGLPARPEYDKELCELAALLGRYEPDQAWPERALLTYLYSFDDIVAQGVDERWFHSLKEPLHGLLYRGGERQTTTTLDWLTRKPLRDNRPFLIPAPVKSQAWCDRVAELLQQRLDAIDPALPPGGPPEPIDADLGEPLWRNLLPSPLPKLPKAKVTEFRRLLLCRHDLLPGALLAQYPSLLDRVRHKDTTDNRPPSQVASGLIFSTDYQSFRFAILDRACGGSPGTVLQMLRAAVRFQHHDDQLSHDSLAMSWRHLCVAMAFNDRRVLDRWAANFEHVYKFGPLTIICELIRAWIRQDPLPKFKTLKTVGKFDNAVIEALAGLVSKDVGRLNAGIQAMLQTFARVDDALFEYKTPGVVCLQAIAIQRAALADGLDVEIPDVPSNDLELVRSPTPDRFETRHIVFPGAQALVENSAQETWPTLFLNRRVREVIDPTAKPEPPKPIKVTNRMVLEAIEKNATEPVSIVLARMPRFKTQNLSYHFSDVVRKSVGREWTCTSGTDGESLLRGLHRSTSNQCALDVRLKDALWLHFWGPPAAANAVEAVIQNKDVSVLTLQYFPKPARWRLEHHKAGRRVTEFGGGKLSSEAASATFTSRDLPASLVKQSRTVLDALIACLDALQAKPRQLIFERSPTLRVRAADGLPLTASDFEEAKVIDFVDVTQDEDPSGAKLKAALEAGDPDAVREAIAQGASLTTVPEWPGSPLMWAMIHRDAPYWLDCVRTLLDAGADTHADQREDPAIVAAVGWDRDEQKEIALLSELLARGADINTRGTAGLSSGGTALHAAAKEGRCATARFLLENGADANAKNNGDRKPADLVGGPNLTRSQENQTSLKQMLLAAERGDPLPPTSTEQLAQTSANERTRAKQNLGSAFEAAFAAMNLESILKADPAKATPEQLVWLMALKQPLTLTLKPVGKPKFRAPAKMAATVRAMTDLGFEQVGVYRPAELDKTLVVGFIHTTLKLFGTVYEMMGVRAIDLFRVYEDGSAVLATTVQEPPFDLGTPDRLVRVRVPGESPSALVEAIEKQTLPQAKVVTPSADAFVKVFKRGYEDTSGFQRAAALEAYNRWAADAS